MVLEADERIVAVAKLAEKDDEDAADRENEEATPSGGTETE